MPPFHFQTLQLDRQQIRLLQLQSGSFHDPISATLSIAYLDDRPKYEALSYVWGDPNVCVDITLDGNTQPVTINLWAALRRLRDLDEDRVLWIDSLCINQADEAEKAYQVGLTTEIYKSTWRGLAWLGEFEEHAVLKPGMSSQAYRASGVTMEMNHAQMAFQFAEKLSKLSADGHFTIERENLQPGWVSVTQPEVSAFQTMISLKWFTRIWTVQEFVLPPRVELLLGSITCEEPLALLVNKPEWDMWKHHPLHGPCCEAVVAKVPELLAVLSYFFDHMPSLRTIKRRLPIHLGYAINRFRYRDCADPRDKVFALLGLAHPKARTLVDYTLDRKQVYTQYVRYDMMSKNSVSPLMRLSERNRDPALPSWVPDLGAAVFDDPGLSVLAIEFLYMVECAPLFSAGSQRGMELGGNREEELQLGGRRVDSVRRICKGPARTLRQNGADSQLMPRLRSSWRTLLDDTEPSLDLSSYPSGGTYAESFWRTCTCDVQVRRDLKVGSRGKRITDGDRERVKKELEYGAFGCGITPMNTFFVSHQGYIGISPEDTQVGDTVYVLFGGHVPFLLREIPETQEIRGSHTFVGHAYVHGIMDGEALEKDIPDEQVIIV